MDKQNPESAYGMWSRHVVTKHQANIRNYRGGSLWPSDIYILCGLCSLRMCTVAPNAGACTSADWNKAIEATGTVNFQSQDMARWNPLSKSGKSHEQPIKFCRKPCIRPAMSKQPIALNSCPLELVHLGLGDGLNPEKKKGKEEGQNTGRWHKIVFDWPLQWTYLRVEDTIIHPSTDQPKAR